MKYQTDFDGPLKKDGCLLCSLTTMVEQGSSCDMSNDHFERFYLYLNRKGLISDENDKSKEGAYVWDHDAVLEAVRNEVGWTPRIRYVGCMWMPWEKKKSWGSREGDYLVLHIKTPNGGHFRLPDFDPWKPGAKMVDLRSLRYYQVQ